MLSIDLNDLCWYCVMCYVVLCDVVCDCCLVCVVVMWCVWLLCGVCDVL